MVIKYTRLYYYDSGEVFQYDQLYYYSGRGGARW